MNEKTDSPADTPAATALPDRRTLPTAWPGAFKLYKYSRNAVMNNVWVIIILLIVPAIIGGIFDWKAEMSGQIVAFLINCLFSVAYTLVLIAAVRGQRIGLIDSLKQSLPLWLKMIGLTILIFLSLAASLLLLIIPFFFVVPRLSLATYFLVDKKMGVLEAYKASWTATKGHSLKVWAIVGTNILMALLMITIIGIPIAIYLLVMYSAALAVLYDYINKQQPASAAPVAVPPTAVPQA